MWSIYTVLCILNLSISPFCSLNGQLPIHFENLESCDRAIDSIVLELDEQLKERNISLKMKCFKNEQVST
jgi:hypothetical protein|tara:strand:+ start:31 stop:240 length:210 start_codon:yes stop_codon:yes gene_type:complete